MSLQKLLSNARELNLAEIDEVSGGSELTTTSYTDTRGVKHSVSIRD